MKAGIDPGRYKTGLALVDGEKLLFSAIIPKSKEDIMIDALTTGKFVLLLPYIKELNVADVTTLQYDELLPVYLGNGTSHKELLEKLKQHEQIQIKVVNEYGSTLQGRKLYFKLHKPRGIWKLIPISLRTPPRDIDDLAAYVIALTENNRQKRR